MWRQDPLPVNVWAPFDRPVALVVTELKSAPGDIVTIFTSEELDPLCGYEAGVTIEVDGVPATILSVAKGLNTNPWDLEYTIDITLVGGEVVTWSYDATQGTMCSLTTGTQLDSTDLSFSLEGGPSQLVNWVPGAGSPTIVGPVYTSLAADAAVNDTTASLIDTLATQTDLLYAEFEVLEAGTTTGNEITACCGWKRVPAMGNSGQSQCLSAYWSNGDTFWKVNRNALGDNSFVFDVQEAAPGPGTIIGVALDLTAKKIYININGNWQTSNSATLGGLPSGGLGWDITNATQVMGLYSSTHADAQKIQARQPQFTPAGYTEVT